TEPELTDKDIVDMSDNEEFATLLEIYKAQEAILKEAGAKLEETKKNIFKMAKHNRVKCHGVKVTQTRSSDSFKPDYKGYIEDNGIELPIEYLKLSKGRLTKRITFPK
ncbi:MAG: hypothetical protein V2I33_07080, partial [Kangiellaceae bacterium]|nr:hypothetical protein [Kangiellaceae bacterium]